jgi:hypothetical protein
MPPPATIDSDEALVAGDVQPRLAPAPVADVEVGEAELRCVMPRLSPLLQSIASMPGQRADQAVLLRGRCPAVPMTIG